MTEYLITALKAAKSAGKVIEENFHKKKKISYKGRIDLVTNIDKKAEEIIIEIIGKKYPKHNILTEETEHKQNSEMEYRWVIDPLDGTTNYVHGFPFVCTSIALQKNDETICGVVYNPILGELFYSEKGAGSFCNNKQISVSDHKELDKSILATGFPYNIENEERNNLDHFNKIIKKCRGIRRPGAAALDLCYVAAGIFDGYWEMELFPWDTAAGILIVEEAGGKVTKFDDSEFSIFDKEILATNGLVHKELVGIL
ncbi:MAG: inositol monophosphatase family protein [Candidatus Cloacimonadota bacterium]|nr:inositol monophosphatase family protein [Candidatus Cloacimonadota bacterium]